MYLYSTWDPRAKRNYYLLFGSTAERVVRKAKCPVMTVRMP